MEKIFCATQGKPSYRDAWQCGIGIRYVEITLDGDKWEVGGGGGRYFRGGMVGYQRGIMGDGRFPLFCCPD